MLPKKRLAEFMQTERYRRACGKVRSYRCPVEPDDLVCEFHVGMLEAARRAELDRGDPVEYVVSQAIFRVKQVVRRACNHEMLEECLGCGVIRPHRWGPCRKCGLSNFALHSRTVPLEIGDDGQIVPKGQAVCKTGGGGKPRQTAFL